MFRFDSLKKVLSFIFKRAPERLSPEGAIALAAIRRRELRVTIEGDDVRHRSLFVGMNDDSAKEIFIDVLGRDLKEDFLVPNKTQLTIFFEMNGIQYSLKTEFLGYEVFGGYDSLKIKMPKTIKQGQRREAFRIEPSLDSPTYIHITDGDPVKAIDISGDGVSFRMKSPLEPGTVIPVNVELPDLNKFLKADFEVIETLHDSTKSMAAKKITAGEYKVRGRFRGLGGASKELIHYYVASRQRELIHLMN